MLYTTIYYLTSLCFTSLYFNFMQFTAINDQIAIAKLLLQHNANVNYAGGILQEIPLQWAIRKSNYEMIMLLVRSGSNMQHKSVQQTDSLHLACRLGDIRAVFLLLFSGADPDSLDANGLSCLYYLVSQQRTLNLQFIDIIRILLHFKADPKTKDPVSGNNLLHFLAIHGQHSNPVKSGVGIENDSDTTTTTAAAVGDRKTSSKSNQNNMLTVAYLLHTSAGATIALDANNVSSTGTKAYLLQQFLG